MWLQTPWKALRGEVSFGLGQESLTPYSSSGPPLPTGKVAAVCYRFFSPLLLGVFLGFFFAQLMVWITFLCMWSANALPDFKHISLQVSFRSWESCLRSPNDSSFLFFILSLQTPADPATTLRFWWLFAPVILVSHYIYIKPDLCILMTWDWLKDVASKCSLKKRKG